MSYLSYLFSSMFKLANNIKIPIVYAPNKIFYFSIFSLFIGFLFVSVIIWFICRLLDFEVSYMFHTFGRFQDNNFKFDNSRYLRQNNRLRSNNISKVYYNTNPSSVHYYSKR